MVNMQAEFKGNIHAMRRIVCLLEIEKSILKLYGIFPDTDKSIKVF